MQIYVVQFHNPIIIRLVSWRITVPACFKLFVWVIEN